MKIIDELNQVLNKINSSITIKNISFEANLSGLEKRNLVNNCIYVCTRTEIIDGIEVCMEYERKCE